jgi:hypothetical protein
MGAAMTFFPKKKKEKKGNKSGTVFLESASKDLSKSPDFTS